jgi:outer membrane lipoprotein carrier protein
MTPLARTFLAGLCAALLGAGLAGVALAADPGEPAAAPAAERACAEAIARRVQARYEGIRDLHARFEQTTRSVALGGAAPAPLAARGSVVFAKPGRMRWSYEEPEPSLVVTDGATLWIYDPRAAEVQKMAVEGAFLSGAAIQFLLGQGSLLAEFEVEGRGCVAARAASREVLLELRPRRPATYERLALLADPDDGDVHETTVHDLFGNVTSVRMQDVRTNQGAAPELFVFQAPEGVRVIELPPAASHSLPQ